jgi:putative flippase GtrA
VATTLVCKQVLNFGVIAGSSTGTIVGGIVNFLIGRNWVFEKSAGRIQNQAGKYFLVWLGNLILTTSGVFAVTHYVHVRNYVISKIIVSCLIGVPYNYLMQKKFVFIK